MTKVKFKELQNQTLNSKVMKTAIINTYNIILFALKKSRYAKFCAISISIISRYISTLKDKRLHLLLHTTTSITNVSITKLTVKLKPLFTLTHTSSKLNRTCCK